jgi:hypothetical protein
VKENRIGQVREGLAILCLHVGPIGL